MQQLKIILYLCRKNFLPIEDEDNNSGKLNVKQNINSPKGH